MSLMTVPLPSFAPHPFSPRGPKRGPFQAGAGSPLDSPAASLPAPLTPFERGAVWPLALELVLGLEFGPGLELELELELGLR